MSKPSLFDYLTNICVDKVGITEDDKGYQPYMINRFISMTNIYLPMVNDINMYQVPITAHYEYYASKLPKRKLYAKYIKKTKTDKKSEDVIERLCKYYEIGLKEAKLYLTILSDEQINDIYDLYETR